MPFVVAVLAAQHRIVSTNSSMHDPDLLSGVNYQTALTANEPVANVVHTFPGIGECSDNRGQPACSICIGDP